MSAATGEWPRGQRPWREEKRDLFGSGIAGRLRIDRAGLSPRGGRAGGCAGPPAGRGAPPGSLLCVLDLRSQRGGSSPAGPAAGTPAAQLGAGLGGGRSPRCSGTQRPTPPCGPAPAESGHTGATSVLFAGVVSGPRGFPLFSVWLSGGETRRGYLYRK